MAESKEASEVGTLLSGAQIRARLNIDQMVQQFMFPKARFEWGGKLLWSEDEFKDWMAGSRSG